MCDTTSTVENKQSKKICSTNCQKHMYVAHQRYSTGSDESTATFIGL